MSEADDRLREKLVIAINAAVRSVLEAEMAAILQGYTSAARKETTTVGQEQVDEIMRELDLDNIVSIRADVERVTRETAQSLKELIALLRALARASSLVHSKCLSGSKHLEELLMQMKEEVTASSPIPEWIQDAQRMTAYFERMQQQHAEFEGLLTNFRSLN